MSEQRRLVSTQRRVPEGEGERYDALWALLHAAATARGAHAWRFVAADRGDLFVEFLEFRAGADPRGETATAAAMRELESAFPCESIQEWREPRATRREPPAPHEP